MKQRFENLEVDRLEKIKPFCILPWVSGVGVTIGLTDKALENASASAENMHTSMKIFMDGSTWKEKSGIGVAFGDG